MLDLDQVAESLAVIGGGYVGCEYALMYSRFGTDVTIIQRGERLLPREGPDISTVIEEVFEDGSPFTPKRRLQRSQRQLTAFVSMGVTPVVAYQ